MANFTKLLLHCDGTDGSTSFPDVSIYAHTVTAAGNAQVDTAQKKFGTGSALFDGTGDYLTSVDSADWDFGTADFTIDAWVRFAATGINNELCSRADADFRIIANNNSGQAQVRFGGAATKVESWSPSTDTWYHFAVTRSGTNLDIWIDGTKLGTTTTNSTDLTYSSALYIGSDEGTFTFLNGFIDEFRISKGIARWTSNFTPPSAAYDDPSSTSSSSSSSSSRSSSSSSKSSSSSSSSCRSSSSSSCSSSSSRSSSSSSSSSKSSSSSSCSSSSSSSRSSSSSCSSSSSSSRSSSSSSSSCSSSSSSCRSSSSSSSSSRSSSSSSRSSSSSSCSSSSCSSSSRSSSSSSSSCRSSSSSSRSSSCSSSSFSHTEYRPEKINKISSTITYEQDKPSDYVIDVDSDLKTVFERVNSGFKPLRMTTAQRNALTQLYSGLIIVNVSTNKLNWYTPLGTWEAITSA